MMAPNRFFKDLIQDRKLQESIRALKRKKKELMDYDLKLNETAEFKMHTFTIAEQDTTN